ncbi:MULTISPECIES: amidohydrolase family protein [Pseudomonas]|uniref:GntR family transcriptional regulator n=1 Tax=Pseudomonas protegens TaxID=380021 RepID=A0A9Q6IJG5_9PSED|nr:MULTISPECIES: amidohydrolase family protein [Pseudomonas]MCO7577419.1 amidohydrolase family protein [Pseudomonas protegens]MCO7583865.1 amidohydrolase family protein [Pseudomonas chlororaphis]MCO7600802.1 amidohydrolase family protein [Pseudomonas chlororaphis]MCY7259465.1 amidohydrolase family protein [Pseudomonas protegens]MDC7815576.1 amidohydrolase family protein [Pseudomonas sp. BLCC-B112]
MPHPKSATAWPPSCAAPRETIQAPSFVLPTGACDTHAHVICADFERYPLVPERSYTPPPAPEALYLDMLRATGMQRGVLVQPSVYGTDNRYMLEVLQRHHDRLRGVAVVDERIGDDELAHMHALGVRGVRINVLFRGGVNLDLMERLAHRVADLGWHLQFLIDVRLLSELQARIARLPCPVVIDHFGHFPARLGVKEPGFELLLRNVAEHGWWVKLSGAYRLSERHPDYADTDALAHALLGVAPERMVWGSDWPHVALESTPDTGSLLDRLRSWAPDERQRQSILVDNPAVLYDFK